MDENLMAVAEAWYSVFPEDRYPDGRPVEKVFVTGNHDWIGYTYGNAAAKKYPDEAERVKHILQRDMSGWWEKAFHESYSPIYAKEIKGFTFIGSHWDGVQAGSSTHGASFHLIEEFMAKNGKSLDPALPFFYVQHPHPKDTCYGSWAWWHDMGIVTKTLSNYPNAIAFSGHSHYSLTDERSIWQGAFTSVGTGSLRYTGTPGGERKPNGFENTGASDWRVDARKLMKKIGTGDCRQGMLWSVYDDCITVKRREFLSDLDIGEDARPEVTEMNAKNRGGKSKDGKDKIASEKKPSFKVTVPAVVSDDKARLFSLEFTATTADGKSQTKLVLPEGFNHSLNHKKAKSSQTCYFRKDELGSGDVCFTVTPMNCFGARGKPLTATFKV